MISYTQQIIEQMLTAKEQIMKLLNWTEQQYTDYQYKCGCQYLQAYIPHCPDQIDELIRNRIYWNWWRNEWLFRDTAFINSEVGKLKPETISHIYLSINDADVLRYEIYPSGVVLNNRYAEMIRDVQKDQVC